MIHVYYSTQVRKTIGNVYEKVIEENVREGLTIQNHGDELLFIAFTKEAADADIGIKINAGEIINFDNVSPKNPIFLKAESTTVDVEILSSIVEKQV